MPSRFLIKISFFLLFFSVAVPSFAAPLIQARTNGLKITLENGQGNTFHLKVEALDGETSLARKVSALVIENPARFVVDVAGISSKTAQSFPVKNSKVSALRVGIHPDKTRIVLDLMVNEVPEYEISDDGEVVFSFKSGTGSSEENLPRPYKESKPVFESPNPKGSESIEIKELPSIEEKPIPTPTPKTPSSRPKEPEKGVSHEDTELPPILSHRQEKVKDVALSASERSSSSQMSSKSEESVDDGSLDEEVPAISNQPGTGLVKSIYYQTLSESGAPAVTMDIDGLDSYSLNKRKSDLYELVIQNAHLGGKHLSLPQFPPDTFKGFSVIVAREEGGNVFVKLYVEENVKLFPFVAKGQLWLKVSQ